ncbi:Cobalt-precorrin-6x reductase [Paramagnetospirillum magnetotacticum MS-1]|uniref:Cobalt-precorrin-6x reductase n=1 Tax=Paramagnetospirillum magnetotacticum MS-1 TaxID=272627 RepID=A0A0C2UZP5_PARME|nr:cobalt-precorrin-6A reductase [Paramagnetospirillum magnetotacticum]KIL98296.1 Cobalt-precorrin-6x reductase [Paramagnetospirillum magnetotacticum MS-1]
MTGTVLILGGTAEAAALARIMADERGRKVIYSLAGRTVTPRLPHGETRTGGFGGVDGLKDYLQRQTVSVVVDATHPFASRMGWNAAQACAALGLPILRLDRPQWEAGPADRWTMVRSWDEAVIHLTPESKRVFLAVGRQELAPFAGLKDIWFLLRFAESTAPQPRPAHFTLIADRGPFTLDGERALLREHAIDTLVCRNSGGTAARAKLTAAAELGLPVLMLRRPPRPEGPSVGSAEEAAAWVRSHFIDAH